MRAPLVLLLACAAALCACGEEEPSSARDGELFDGPAAEAGEAPIPPALELPADAPTVVFLSDSIGAGLHLAEHQAFPALLQRRLSEAGRPFRLVSSSESGRTTAGGVTALDWVLRSEPQLVVLTLGGNDGLRGVALDEVEANLRAIIERSRAAGARVLLLGVRLPPNYGDYGGEFDALYPRLAEELELDFVPSFMQGVGGVADANLADGLHPTAAGHERLADNVQPKLRELLDELAD